MRWNRVPDPENWVCDYCGKCGDPACCPRRVIYRLDDTEECRCSFHVGMALDQPPSVPVSNVPFL